MNEKIFGPRISTISSMIIKDLCESYILVDIVSHKPHPFPALMGHAMCDTFLLYCRSSITKVAALWLEL